MKSVAAVLGLCLLAVAFAAEESDQIRQCTCDEIDKCHQEAREKFRPCVQECVKKLTHPDLDAEAGHKCFEPKHNHHECFKEVRKTMCAAESGAMLNRNETFQGHHDHHKKGRKNTNNDVLEEQATRHHHGHHRHGLFALIKKNFGESGKEYVQCMKSCFAQKKPGHCQKSLGCGLRKLSKDEWKAKTEKCRGAHMEHRHELCECLKTAGMKKLDCEAPHPKEGKSGEQQEQNEV
ncbi:Protein F55H12.4 [Aphelenchoides avenae]|nr:Protein F55H12.4 [Aphelenchus avenae]